MARAPEERFWELPLDRWPIVDNLDLRKARVVLSADLTPVVDFFNDHSVGVGARDCTQTVDELPLGPSDQRVLGKLLRLGSYDVYTLRASLGEARSV
jgi:hypothetical protein